MRGRTLITLGVMVAAMTISTAFGQSDTAMINGRVERLRAAVGLTDAQAAKVKAIYTASWADMQKLREQGGDDREARREAARARQQETDKKIEALLTPEQKAKFEEFKKQRRGPGMGPPGREGAR